LANRLPDSCFDLPARLAAKSTAELIDADERHFAAISTSLERSITELIDRLDTERRAPGGTGQAAMDRDMEVHRLSSRLRTLQRYGIDLCLGRMVDAATGDIAYIGRLGLTDADGEALLLDWRSPAAEPFFGATLGDPMGLASRRRYRWTAGRITDYWDETFGLDGEPGVRDAAALDDQSAFIASLGADRSSRMRDVLGTIAADQDAIIRADSRGALVVDGGPGTGKTVVALHRAAYLRYRDPRLSDRRGGVLVVGPHRPYLAYVADVLPSLGEEGVRTCTLRDLVAEGAAARAEPDQTVACLKADARLLDAIEPAVRFYEKPPTTSLVVESDWADVELTPTDWAIAFEAAEPGVSHNESRGMVWAELLAILVDKHDREAPAEQIRQSLSRNDELGAVFGKAWPLLEAADVVGDLLSVPAYLRMCAPWLTADQIRALQRDDPKAWTVSDLPLLDAARQRIGDPESVRRHHRRATELAAEARRRADVTADLLAANEFDDGEGLLPMLRQWDLQEILIDGGAAVETLEPDQYAGPFGHIVVDEAQELTDAQWQMLLRRCPSRSFTIVGDRAQTGDGMSESWIERFRRIGLDQIEVATLTINYRTPEEVMTEAEPVIRAAIPDANVPTSIRSNGVPVRRGAVTELRDIVNEFLARPGDGIACVIGDPEFREVDRVRSLTPRLAKGLEFDLVVLVRPDDFGAGVTGAVDRYVAMTRATRELVVLS
jgi:hypothetical protein